MTSRAAAGRLVAPALGHGGAAAGPFFITEKAEATSWAAPLATPEWTPAAANRSGYSLARIAAIAPPADRPAT